MGALHKKHPPGDCASIYKFVDAPSELIAAITQSVQAGQSYEADGANLTAQWVKYHRDEQLMRIHKLACECGARAYVARDFSRVIFRPAPRPRPKRRVRSRKGEASAPYIPLRQR